MKIFILEGKNKGNTYPVKKGVIFGRSKGDIIIADPKASNPHAKIVSKQKKLYLQDLDSKNGTYVNGEINDYFELKIGMEFQIGEVVFQIKPSKPKKKPKTHMTRKTDPHWSKLVADELRTQQHQVKNSSQKLSPILPPCTLHFLSGPQKGTKWTLYFGPRVVSKSSLDLTLLDQNAPDGECFSLHPTRDGKLIFKTIHSDLVLINNQYRNTHILKTKDQILFSNTVIRVQFLS